VIGKYEIALVIDKPTIFKGVKHRCCRFKRIGEVLNDGEREEKVNAATPKRKSVNIRD